MNVGVNQFVFLYSTNDLLFGDDSPDFLVFGSKTISLVTKPSLHKSVDNYVTTTEIAVRLGKIQNRGNKMYCKNRNLKYLPSG